MPRHKKKQLSSDSNYDGNSIYIQAIIYDSFASSASQDSKKIAKELLTGQANNLEIGQSGENIVYGNDKGHGIFTKLEEHEEKLERQGMILENVRKELESHKRQLEFLNPRMDTLRQLSEGYLDIRRRFLDIYRRDIKHPKEKKTTKAIRDGNAAAHDGDAVADAFLFECDKRTDRTTFRELYGLEADQVLHYHELNNDNRLAAVLNAHANLVVRGHTVSSELKSAFQKFLITVEESWETPTDDSIDAAYFRFWNHYPQDSLESSKNCLAEKRQGNKG